MILLWTNTQHLLGLFLEAIIDIKGLMAEFI